MPACKVCGSWFVKIKPHEELCDKCECALCRLSSYVARVTRCKDCKHRHSDSWCEYVDDDDNFYCARGERKEGAD